jgi:ketosteroid isomerase-like protein
MRTTIVMEAEPMRKSLLILTVILVSCAPRSARHSIPTDEAEIVRLENAWRKARVVGDTAFLNSLYAPELRIQGSNGAVITRDTDIGLFAKGVIRPEFIIAEEMHVSLYGDVALVTGVDHLKGSYGSTTGEGRLRFMDAFVRRGGRWQLVANQGTWVAGDRVGRN